ncbi:MAG: tetratricopeptide repeat protein [Candidatus Marinimicrobia bacterium]|nr:tetratricopeptide repeat protein [Candidatus Neomarinimicrobiota bacterium]
MTIKRNKILFLLFSIAILTITGCVSSSMEYRSATTAARSEKNLKKAEEWGLKALAIEADSSNAHIPYFLAIEVYKPKKNWVKMAEMLDEAVRRNPTQQLERPIVIDRDNIFLTIEEGVKTYREEEWSKLYNLSVEYFQKDEFELAIQNLEIAIKMDPSRGESYGTLAALHLQKENPYKAKEIALVGSKNAPRYSLNYQVLADIAIKAENLDEAEKYYETAIENTDAPGPIMRQLIFLYIDKGETQRAIEYSDVLLNKYPNDPDLYFNIGVLFQRLALEAFDPARELYLALPNLPTLDDVKPVFDRFSNSRKYAYNARDYFLQASDLEIEGDGSSGRAAIEMRKLMKQIDEIFVPSIREIARSQNIDLN